MQVDVLFERHFDISVYCGEHGDDCRMVYEPTHLDDLPQFHSDEAC